MLTGIDRKRAIMMVNVSSFSPLVYGVLSFLLSGHAFRSPAYLEQLNTMLLFTAFGFLIASRPVEALLAPGKSRARDLPPGRAALACLLVSALAEGPGFMGFIIVLLGAGFKAFIPYFFLGVLAFADFRFSRFPRLVAMVPEAPPDEPPD